MPACLSCRLVVGDTYSTYLERAMLDNDDPSQSDPPPPYSPSTTSQRSSSIVSTDETDVKESTTLNDGIPESDQRRIAAWAKSERDRIYRWAEGEKRRIAAIMATLGDEEVDNAVRRREREVDDGLRRVEKQAWEAMERAKRAASNR